MIAAVRSGADAVYVGGKNYSARMSADNFTVEELDECIKYCHSRNVKVYVTVNILVFDEELENVIDYVSELVNIDTDALIIQDTGLAYAIHKMYPSLRLHASTQMSIHTISGVQALYELGFKRVVLSRELSKAEIKNIHEACPEMELEVFVHGALCMSVSGQCYFSSMLGGRSANRGMCAQTCRLPFRADGCGNYALSLKDNSIIDRLDELYEIGVSSAKIEGRMKREEYVAAATRACAEMKNTGFVSEKTKYELENVFSRTGFTDGYFTGKTGPDMFGYRQKDDVVSATDRLFKEIRNSYKDEKQKIKADLYFEARIGEFPKLSSGDTAVYGDKKCEKALNHPISNEKIRENLSKCGGTQFIIGNTDIVSDEELSLPLSVINKMRRELFEKLSVQMEKRHDYSKACDFQDILNGAKETEKGNEYEYAVSYDLEFCSQMKKFKCIFCDIFKLNTENVKKLTDEGYSIGIEIPRVIFKNENLVIEKLKLLKKSGIKDVLCHNLGSVFFSRKLGFTVHGGFGLNVSNSLSVLFFKSLGVADIQTSIELSLQQFGRLKRYIPLGFVKYGYIPVMITRNCPVKGTGISCSSCKKDKYLQDRMNKRFRVFCHGEHVEILNCVPLILPQKIYEDAAPDFTIFNFYVENSVENKEKIIVKMSQNEVFNNFTRGLALKGVKKITYF